MTKDNHLLDKLELHGIPPAPRGVPQIDVTFELDVNGILHVAAVDKATGRSVKITIANDKGRLSADEIERIIEEAEKFAAENMKIKFRNGLETYLHNLKNMLNDEEKCLSGQIEVAEKNKIIHVVDQCFDWLVENSDAEAQDEVEKVANKAMKNVVSVCAPSVSAAVMEMEID